MIFKTAGLLSKWGFEDGDQIDGLLDWAGYKDSDPTLLTQRDEYGVVYGFNHLVLFTVVAAHIVPALDQKVELGLYRTMHNPVCATRVDSKAVDDERDGELTPAEVEVPDETILAIARALHVGVDQ